MSIEKKFICPNQFGFGVVAKTKTPHVKGDLEFDSDGNT
jgi:hypothetical protein